MNELEVLEVVEQAKGKQKEKILSEHSHNPRLQELLDAALNFKRKFHVKKFDESLGFYTGDTSKIPTVGSTDNHHIFMEVLSMLERRDITGHDALSLLNSYFHVFDENDLEAKWYRRVLFKDLKAGFGISTAIKAGFDVPKFDVQLAKDGNKCKQLDKILSGTVFLSPKLDGYRCLAVVVNGEATLYSRNGTVYENFPAIKESLEALCSPDYNYVFDGEIMSDDFNSMQQSAFASKRGTVVGDVSYHIFDMIPYDEWQTEKFKMKAGDRYLSLDTFFTGQMQMIQKLGNLKIVFHHKIDAPKREEIAQYEQACIAGGFEGCMLNPNIPYYKGKPSNKMLKFKTFETWDCEIIGFYEGEKGTRNEGRLGGITVKQENDVQCDVGTGFSDEEREHIWANQSMYLGRILEVSYQELTPDNKMRFPAKVRWRPDKD